MEYKAEGWGGEWGGGARETVKNIYKITHGYMIARQVNIRCTNYKSTTTVSKL